MFSQLRNALHHCRQQGELPTIREKMSFFQGWTALPPELHFRVVRSYYNVRCWIWKWKHFYSLLFLSTPESHEERRRKAVMQLDYESCNILHGLEGEGKVKRGRMLEELGIEELRLRKGKANPLWLFSPSAVLCSQQWLWKPHKNRSWRWENQKADNRA